MTIAKIIMFATLIIMLDGCATSMSNRPTPELIDKQLKYPTRVVSFQMMADPVALKQRLLDFAKGCVAREITKSGTAVAGPNLYVPVSVTTQQLMESGVRPDGTHWVVLRMDGFAMHTIAFGVEMNNTNNIMTTIKAYPADRKRIDQIKALVESGQIFCHWRNVSDPWG